MGRRAVRFLFAIAMASAPGDARAEADLDVTHGEGAEQCPQAAELLRLVVSSWAPALLSPTHVYRVSFEWAGGYRAEIVDETAKRTRRLEDKGGDCAPLARAAAVVLATMWDSEGREGASVTDPAPQPPAPPRTGTVDAVDSSKRGSASPPRWLFGAGVGLAEGILRPAAPAFLIDGAFEYGHGSISIGALWIPAQHIGLRPGAVDVQLIAARAGGCASLWETTRLGVCGGAFAGDLLAASSGYSIDMHATRPWVALGLELFVDGPVPLAPIRYRAAVGAIVPVHAEAFAVAGAGVAYETPPFGGLFTLSLVVATH